MDGLTFASKIIESLAWPAVSVLITILLRDEISKLVPLVKKVKAGPLEAEFEREVKELKEIAATSQILSEPNGISPKPSPSVNLLLHLAEFHPRSAILESWVRVEAAARAALAHQSTSVTSPNYVPASRLAEPLAQKNILDEADVTLFHEIRRLRNEVAHAQGFEPTTTTAMEYIDLAEILLNKLENYATRN